jgi:peptide/nickel transport system permease protein
MVIAFFGQAVPFFWLALILVLVFALQLQLLPATGTVQQDGWQALVLPVAAICIPNVATLSRLVRGQVVDVLQQPYVAAAVSKGLSSRRVLFRHVLPNAVPPIISWVAIQFSFLLGSTIILEPIFNYQGMGTVMIQGVTGRDFSTVEAGVFLFSALVIGANLAGDVANRVLDPRLRQATR